MNNVYKIILYSRNIYKEVELLPDVNQISIGTYYDNTIRLTKELFLEDFYIELSQLDYDKWEIECSPNVYFYLGDIRKMLRLNIKHGDDFGLRYQNADGDFLHVAVAFSINFDNKEKKFQDRIRLDSLTEISIGGSVQSNIVLLDKITKSDSVFLKWNSGELIMTIQATKYGIWVNGIPVKEKCVIHDCDFISIADYQFYYKNHFLYTDINEKIRVNGITVSRDGENSCFEYPLFNRNTRIASKVPTEPIAILDPPEKPEKPKNNLLISILPTVAMLILTIIIRGFMSSGSSSSFVIFSACTMGIGIITSIVTYFQGKKEYRTSIQEREEKYNQYIKEKEKQIEGFREKEKNILCYNYPDIEKVNKRVKDFAGNLFDRTYIDEDFLEVRVGSGTIEAQRKVNYKFQERFITDDILVYLPEMVMMKYKNIDGAPVVLKLKGANAIGIVGDEQNQYKIAKNIIVDLACRQYKDELKMAFVLNEGQKDEFEWIRFLPNVKSSGSYLRLISCDTDSRINLFETLYKEFSHRKEISAKNSKHEVFTHFVIFVLHSEYLMTHPVSKFISIAASINVTFIFFEKNKEMLPLGITQIINVENKKAELIDVFDDNKKIEFDFKVLNSMDMHNLAVRLAPVYCKEINLEGSLMKSISLFELLNIYSVEDLDLSSRWECANTHKSMAAPIGVKAKNEVVSLDIHEKAHGPHGLVAGTTGSGKSEILQSYILSMSTLYHPYEVGFVIIDFKGGGMANQFLGLPHLMGTITNIDGKQIERSLMSIKAELLKRQRYFSEAEVNHIDRYIMKYKNGEVERPLPHLIIIVDEFAELKAEHPNFMKELISTSRIGRSLGVHLILATQKPSGQVNEQIWSNSRFKLCLKVQSMEDSNEMIKSPLAAEILEPGRAYFQVGNNEIFDLFQSGFSGAPEKISTDAISSRDYQLSEVSFEGKRTNIFTKTVAGEARAKRTQLEALVEYIHGYCEEKKIVKLDSICMPPLPEVIQFPIDLAVFDSKDCIVEIGMMDDPENQQQIPTYINFSQDNVIVIGSAQCGKTNLLQLIIRGLCTRYTADEVNIYILDFGSMVLRSFDNLKHVGGVVIQNEDEKFKNLMKLLLSEIEERKEKLMQAGVSSFSSYREAGYKDMPQIVLLIDNYTAVKEYYLQDEDPIVQISREGITVGISTVISNAQTSGMGYRYMSNFAKRIVFYCNESGEYSNVIEKCRVVPDNTPGRALTEFNKKIYELQTYLSFEGEREVERVTTMRNFVDFINKQVSGKARRIPVIPEVLELDEFTENYSQQEYTPYVIPVGVVYDSIAPITIDLLNQGWFAIAGRERAGNRNLLRVIYDYLYNNMFMCPAEVYIVDSIDKKLSEFEHLGIVEEYSIDGADAVTIVEDVYTTLTKRYQEFSSGNINLAEEALKLIVIRNQEAIDVISKNITIMKEYKELIGKLKFMKVCFIFMDIPNTSISYNAPEIMKNIKDSKNFFFFDDIQNLKIVDISTVTLRKFKKKISMGDAYWLKGNEISKVKTIKRKEK